MKKKRILVLTSTFPRWKNDTTPPFVYELEKRLTKDFDIHILAPHYRGAKKEEMMDGLRVHRFQYFWPEKLQKLCYEGGILPSLKFNKLLYTQTITLFLFEMIAIVKLFRKYKFDLIHAHWTIPSGLISIIAKYFFKTSVLVTAHAGDVFTENKVVQHLNDFVVSHADFLTVNSRATKKALLKRINHFHLVDIVPMGINTANFRPIKKLQQVKKILLFVGRLVEKKGIVYLLRAMPQILKNIPKIQLLIVGEGPEAKNLRNLTHSLGLDKNVTFLGGISNNKLPYFYNIADVVIAPSIKTKTGDTEGLGVVLLEAMACGKPVVGTKVGGIPDVIKNNETGVLIRPNSISQISQAVIKLLTNRKLRGKLIINARQYVKTNFDWLVIAKKFKKIYEKI